MNLANWITILRILLVPFLLMQLVYYAASHEYLRWTALATFCFASLTDAIDGYIARRSNQKSKLGTYLDPAADKLLLVSAFLGIYYSSGFLLKPPAWIIILIVSRDVLIAIVFVIMYLAGISMKAEPNFLGKATTCCQIGCVLLFLLGHQFALPVVYFTAVLTLTSGLVYIFRERQRLNNNKIVAKEMTPQ